MQRAFLTSSGSPPREWGQRRGGRRCGQNHGSPPREWGQLGARGPARGARRFTPTRVGTAGVSPIHIALLRVHPHASGDSVPGEAVTGSPISVHPHASGDSSSEDDALEELQGSPPREWGQPSLGAEVVFGYRFTPTRVGTATAANFANGEPTRVHPHASGDSSAAWSGPRHMVGVAGSPPREWGQLREFLQRVAVARLRFTPTRVGTARNRCLSCQDVPSQGSPPREWGQHVPTQPRQLPAC